MNDALELIAWLAVFASILTGIMFMLMILILHDTTQYDMEFLWDGKYTLEELELSK